MTDLEGEILNAFKEKSVTWWTCIDGIFFIWEESLENFLKNLIVFI